MKKSFTIIVIMIFIIIGIFTFLALQNLNRANNDFDSGIDTSAVPRIPQ